MEVPRQPRRRDPTAEQLRALLGLPESTSPPRDLATLLGEVRPARPSRLAQLLAEAAGR
jgi:hypothetical protein